MEQVDGESRGQEQRWRLAMHTTEIPRDHWEPYLAGFSREHQGEHVIVELLGTDLGHQPELRDVPLLGVTFDTKRSDGEAIEVMAGDSPAANAMHIVAKPVRMLVAISDEGADQALEIESLEGPTTLLRFAPGQA
ncbi:MAG TPA: DUF5335 family protein [Tepidisphaeraceae bacterium]|nr:DUF5335 family protein [Tepidisphaeraceae bacterium]